MLMRVKLIQIRLPAEAAMTAPPRIIPNRIAREVPDWNRALPDISSSGFRTSGKMAYLIGPTEVDWMTITNQANNRIHNLNRNKPIVLSYMMIIPCNLRKEFSCEHSYLSAT